MLLEAKRRPMKSEGSLPAEWAEQRVAELRRDRDAR
jgi:hypothetical protein